MYCYQWKNDLNGTRFELTTFGSVSNDLITSQLSNFSCWFHLSILLVSSKTKVKITKVQFVKHKTFLLFSTDWWTLKLCLIKLQRKLLLKLVVEHAKALFWDLCCPAFSYHHCLTVMTFLHMLMTITKSNRRTGISTAI